MPEIINRKDCSPQEIEKLKQFFESHSPPLVQFINAGAGVSKGTIKSQSELAKTFTEWHTLGGIRSRKDCKLKYFPVDRVMDVLKNPRCNDRYDMNLIQKYNQEIAKDTFKSTITLFENGNETFIYDGNHSAVAFFEHYSECGVDDVNIEVFIVTDTTKFRIFLIRCYNFIWYTLKNKKILLPL